MFHKPQYTGWFYFTFFRYCGSSFWIRTYSDFSSWWKGTNCQDDHMEHICEFKLVNKCLLQTAIMAYYLRNDRSTHLHLFTFTKQWTDPFLRWNSSTYGGLKDIRFPSSFIWTPHVTCWSRYGYLKPRLHFTNY